MDSFERMMIKNLKARYRLGGYLSVEDLCILSDVLKKDLLSGDFGECAICNNTITKETCYDLACGHYFHNSCITQWIHVKKGKIICPLCKQETIMLEEESSKEIDDDDEEEDY